MKCGARQEAPPCNPAAGSPAGLSEVPQPPPSPALSVGGPVILQVSAQSEMIIYTAG